MPCMKIQRYDWITSKKKKYPIIFAAYTGDLPNLKQGLQRVGDVTQIQDSETKTSVLSWAVVGDQLAIVRYLVEEYPQLLEVTNKYGSNPLFLCSVPGNVDMFKLFEQKGVSPYKKISNIDNVLMLTAARGHLDLTRYIAKRYPVLLRQNSKHKMDVFLYSCYSGSLHVFDFMFQNGFDPRVSDIDGINCLMIAAYCGHEQLLLHILRNGAELGIDIHAVDNMSNTAVVYAMLGQHQSIIDTLHDAGLESPNLLKLLMSWPYMLWKRWWLKNADIEGNILD